MHDLLLVNFDNLGEISLSKIVHIIEHLVLNLWDAVAFKELFYFDIDYNSEDHMINISHFDQCLKFLQVPF